MKDVCSMLLKSLTGSNYDSKTWVYIIFSYDRSFSEYRKLKIEIMTFSMISGKLHGVDELEFKLSMRYYIKD